MAGVSMRKSEQDVIYLLSCAVNEKTPDHDRVEAMNLDEVYAIASRHMISAVVAYALESAGYKDKQSTKHVAKAMKRALIFKSAWEEIRAELEEKQIWYVPLKGAVLQYYYPKFGLREMADYDILIDPEKALDVKEIMERLGYTTEKFNKGNHDIYQKQPMLNFEMHTSLFSIHANERLYQYYQDVVKRLIPCGKNEMCFTPEDFYLYLLSHEYKHYSISGTGLRSLLDIYIFLQKSTIDMEYILSETRKIGIADFEKSNRELAQNLFSGKAFYADKTEMLDYVFSSGAYGSFKQKIKNRMKSNNCGKIGYVLGRVLIPFSKKNKNYNKYAVEYAFFYRHKVFLPMLFIFRLFKGLTGGKGIREFKELMKIKQ